MYEGVLIINLDQICLSCSCELNFFPNESFQYSRVEFYAEYFIEKSLIFNWIQSNWVILKSIDKEHRLEVDLLVQNLICFLSILDDEKQSLVHKIHVLHNTDDAQLGVTRETWISFLKIFLFSYYYFLSFSLSLSRHGDQFSFFVEFFLL